jgi:FixJ family two-component response regulator
MKSTRIAIVDDDKALRASLSDLMRSMGYEITLFESADRFLETADFDEFDGVIADMQMPGSSGLDLARALRAQRRRLPVILITARPEKQYEAEAVSAGTVALLRKPLDPAALFAQVERSFV